MSEPERLLWEGAQILSIPITTTQAGQLSVYVEELSRWSKVVDLVSQTDKETIVRKHFLDSLAVYSLVPQFGSILDIGSGAGFPGLVLAVVKPTVSFFLLEPRRKRVNFLKEVIRKTGITNASVYEGRTEDILKNGKNRGAFDVVVSRATWNLKRLLPAAAPFLKSGGSLLTMKGPHPHQEIADTAQVLREKGFVLQKSLPYALPFGNEKRAALLFTKKSFT
ncbi:MAG: 16S rRNA (guanine(527)-N(7))-methyltransferase RsmG [Candidatus Binatia bacterium]